MKPFKGKPLDIVRMVVLFIHQLYLHDKYINNVYTEETEKRLNNFCQSRIQYIR